MGRRYYIATSTFHWFPGVCIHRSDDLAHWELVGYALTRPSQLDMRGLGDHAGVWAPCLSHDGNRFYLVYTVIQSRPAYLADAPNYLVTAEAIEGPWSDPVYLNGRGFDPSLFHDVDGRKWLVQMQWDHRPDRNGFAGILLQQYDVPAERLTGPSRRIFSGSVAGRTEGPHLYRRHGWYYLLTAEGGTSWEHRVTVARSRDIEGPYELSPHGPVVTSHDDPDTELQKAGHGSLVSTPDDQWYLAHLCSRPVGTPKRCTLGRETAIQAVSWDAQGWPRLTVGGHTPRVSVPTTHVFHSTDPKPEEVIKFDGSELDPRLCTLREPVTDGWLSLTDQPGWLSMRGRWSLHAPRDQSLVARRVQHHRCSAETRVAFAPAHFQQMAGLVAYYDTKAHYYLHLTYDEEVGRCLSIMACDCGRLSTPLSSPVPVDTKVCDLRAELDETHLQFSYRTRGKAWSPIGSRLDATILSDDYAEHDGFTGMFFGLCVQDMTGQGLSAGFKHLTYTPAVEHEREYLEPVIKARHTRSRVRTSSAKA